MDKPTSDTLRHRNVENITESASSHSTSEQVPQHKVQFSKISLFRIFTINNLTIHDAHSLYKNKTAIWKASIQMTIALSMTNRSATFEPWSANQTTKTRCWANFSIIYRNDGKTTRFVRYSHFSWFSVFCILSFWGQLLWWSWYVGDIPCFRFHQLWSS